MLSFFLDTNRINSKQKCEYMNELERLATDKKCCLLMPFHAWKESEIGNNQCRTEKTWEYSYAKLIENEDQKYWYGEIEKIVFPNGARTENEKNDIWILVTAREMKYPIITNDGDSKKQRGGMLGNAQELKKIGVTVMRDLEAVAWIKEQ